MGCWSTTSVDCINFAPRRCLWRCVGVTSGYPRPIDLRPELVGKVPFFDALPLQLFPTDGRGYGPAPA